MMMQRAFFPSPKALWSWMLPGGEKETVAGVGNSVLQPCTLATCRRYNWYWWDMNLFWIEPGECLAIICDLLFLFLLFGKITATNGLKQAEQTLMQTGWQKDVCSLLQSPSLLPLVMASGKAFMPSMKVCVGRPLPVVPLGSFTLH